MTITQDILEMLPQTRPQTADLLTRIRSEVARGLAGTCPAGTLGNIQALLEHTRPEPLTTASVGELSKQIDCSAAEVLDSLANAGVASYWLHGLRYDLAGVRERVRLHWEFDLTPDIECDCTAGQVAALSREWGVSEQEVSRG